MTDLNEMVASLLNLMERVEMLEKQSTPSSNVAVLQPLRAEVATLEARLETEKRAADALRDSMGIRASRSLYQRRTAASKLLRLIENLKHESV